MDGPRFDQITRRFAAGQTRRRLLGGLSGALATLLGLVVVTGGEARKKARIEGPCGNGGGKANRCRRNRQCCTGYCKKRKRHKGKKQKVKGRCRCRKHNQACQEDRNCCPERTGRSCRGGICQPSCGSGGPCTVFVTSTTHQGDLGGLTGADTICNGLAQAAGLGGAFLAWLSDGTGSPATRFDKTSGPYQLVNGITIASDWAALTAGTLANPIDVTETRGGVGAANRVLSDTNPDGSCRSCASSENNCDRWTEAGQAETMGNYGIAGATNSDWTNRTNSVSCSGWLDGDTTHQYRLYCFQQP